MQIIGEMKKKNKFSINSYFAKITNGIINVKTVNRIKSVRSAFSRAKDYAIF